MQSRQPVHIKAFLTDTTSGRTEIRHLIYSPYMEISYTNLQSKLEDAFHLKDRELNIFWKDNENDNISIRTDDEVTIALKEIGSDILRLHIKSVPRKKPLKQQEKGLPQLECSRCKLEIIGCTYKCLECLNYNLCEVCERKHSHAEHFTMRVSNTVCKECMDHFEEVCADVTCLVREMRNLKQFPSHCQTGYKSVASTDCVNHTDCFQHAEIKQNDVKSTIITNLPGDKYKPQFEGVQKEGKIFEDEIAEDSVKIEPVPSLTEDVLRSVTQLKADQSGKRHRDAPQYMTDHTSMEIDLIPMEVGRNAVNRINEDYGSRPDSGDDSWAFVSESDVVMR